MNGITTRRKNKMLKERKKLTAESLTLAFSYGQEAFQNNEERIPALCSKMKSLMDSLEIKQIGEGGAETFFLLSQRLGQRKLKFFCILIFYNNSDPPTSLNWARIKQND